MNKNMKIKEKKSSFTPLTCFLLIVLILYCLSLFYLLAWTVITSLKANQDVYELDRYGFIINFKRYYNSWGTELDADLIKRALLSKAKQEGSLYLYAYRHMLADFKMPTDPMPGHPASEVGILSMYGYTFLYAGGCALTATFVPCITAYACARFNYKFSKLIHTVVIVVMMIPIVGSLPSEIEMARAFGVMNSIWGLWIMKANFLGLYFLVFYDIFKGLPVSFTEAAKMDGANNFQIFFKIAMPLIKNTFFTVLLIKFITFWNDYQSPKIFMPSYPTIANGMHYIMFLNADKGTIYTHVPARMAIVILTALPVTILFMCFQKRLLGNLTMGGVKG